MRRIEKALNALIDNHCPDWLGEELAVDHETKILDEKDRIIGCRGITCVKCWYQEYIECYLQECNNENNTEDYDLIEDV